MEENQNHNQPDPLADEIADALESELNSQGGDDELNRIKRQALADLKPLIGRVKLAPKEKFNMLMMIIRATDDKNLISQAYETAREIKDESKRAEALIEVIDEISYLASQKASQ